MQRNGWCEGTGQQARNATAAGCAAWRAGRNPAARTQALKGDCLPGLSRHQAGNGSRGELRSHPCAERVATCGQNIAAAVARRQRGGWRPQARVQRRSDAVLLAADNGASRRGSQRAHRELRHRPCRRRSLGRWAMPETSRDRCSDDRCWGNRLGAPQVSPERILKPRRRCSDFGCDDPCNSVQHGRWIAQRGSCRGGRQRGAGGRGCTASVSAGPDAGGPLGQVVGCHKVQQHFKHVL